MNLENYLYSLCQHRSTLTVETCTHCSQLEVDGTLMRISKELDALLDAKRIDEMGLYIKQVEFEGSDLSLDRRARKPLRAFKYQGRKLYEREDFFSKLDAFANGTEIDNGQLKFNPKKDFVAGAHMPPGLRTLDTYWEYKIKQLQTFPANFHK